VQGRLKLVMSSVITVFADGGYAGKLLGFARRALRIAVEIVPKPADQKGFAVLPRRVVERTFAWLVRHRRLDHDYERLPATSEAMIKWAMIARMLCRLAPAPGRQPWQSNPSL
jgi:transposase